MLKSLKFVQGAVAKKDFVPALTHFRIENGLIRGFNGKIGLCSPIDLDLDISPKALPFIKAIQTCKTTVSMHVTEAGRLAIKSGKFKAFVPCTDEIYPDIEPEGDIIELNGEFLPALKKLSPFIAEDASRPWARGILLCNQSAFATNNIIVVEYWLGYDFPRAINIPKNAIQEIIRVNEEPTHLQISANTATFHYGKDKWLKTQLFDITWPDLYKILNTDHVTQPIPEGFYEAVEDLAPFVDEVGRIHFNDKGITTSLDDGLGATMEIEGLPNTGCFHFKHLLLTKDIVEKIDFTSYPKPCLFTGDRLRGALMGVRI